MNVIRLPVPFSPLPLLALAFSKRLRNRLDRLLSSLSGSCGGRKAEFFPGSDHSLLVSRPRISLQQSPKQNPFPVFRRLPLTAVLISQRSRTSPHRPPTARIDLRRWTMILSRISFLLSRTSTWQKISVHSPLLYYMRAFLLSLHRRILRRRPAYLPQRRQVSTPPIITSHLRTHWEILPRAPLRLLWQDLGQWRKLLARRRDGVVWK
jgi:hypothetical protein